MKKLTFTLTIAIVFVLILTGCGMHYIPPTVPMTFNINPPVALITPITQNKIEIQKDAAYNIPYCDEVSDPSTISCLKRQHVKTKEFNDLIRKSFAVMKPITSGAKKYIKITVLKTGVINTAAAMNGYLICYAYYQVDTSDGYSRIFRLEAQSIHTYHYAVSNTIPKLLDAIINDGQLKSFLTTDSR